MTDDQAFLSALLERPEDEGALQVYADWLEERGDSRGAYLRLQSEFRKFRTDETRRRLIELYPHEHAAWTATLEQAGAIEANLTKFEFAWWGTEIEPARASASTYERFRYQDQPSLPVQLFDGSFSWLTASESRSSHDQASTWKAFCEEQRRRGLFVPREFERFMADSELPGRIQSCTDNYFELPPNATSELRGPSSEWDEGLFVGFYADSQYCLLWGILLPREPGRYAPILAGPPDVLFPDLDLANGDDEPVGKPVLAASQFEQFIFRWWIENEIWYATRWEESRWELTPMEQAYIDHLNRTYSNRSGSTGH